MHWPNSLSYLQIFKFWIPNHKFIYRILFIVILFTYKALPQIEQTIIVFSNNTVEKINLLRKGFPSSWNSFNLYPVRRKYQNRERFLYAVNSKWEMIHCCFVMACVVPVNIDVVTLETRQTIFILVAEGYKLLRS